LVIFEIVFGPDAPDIVTEVALVIDADPVILFTIFNVIVYFLGVHKTICVSGNSSSSLSSVAVHVYVTFPISAFVIVTSFVVSPAAAPPAQRYSAVPINSFAFAVSVMFTFFSAVRGPVISKLLPRSHVVSAVGLVASTVSKVESAVHASESVGSVILIGVEPNADTAL
jgi:ABC-type transport system involved in cytochrome c biogenesis permease subunit